MLKLRSCKSKVKENMIGMIEEILEIEYVMKKHVAIESMVDNLIERKFTKRIVIIIVDQKEKVEEENKFMKRMMILEKFLIMKEEERLKSKFLHRIHRPRKWV